MWYNQLTKGDFTLSNYNVAVTLENIKAITVMFLDIFIMWLVLYYAIKIIRSNSRTIQIFKGILLIVLLDALAKFLGLKTLAYLTDVFINWGFLAVIIIFQPEIRSLLERMGKTNVFSRINTLTGNEKEKLVDQIVTATMLLSKDQTGALISIEQSYPLDDFIATGTKLNSDVTAELLTSLFVTSTPLHDGAVIIQGDKIACASAYFPPTNLDLPSRFGARHRAAIGISEITDALTICVSEETGKISVTENGKIYTVDQKQLRNYLLRVICGEETEVKAETHRTSEDLTVDEDDEAAKEKVQVIPTKKETVVKEETKVIEEKEDLSDTTNIKLGDTGMVKRVSIKKREKIPVVEVVPAENLVTEEVTSEKVEEPISEAEKKESLESAQRLAEKSAIKLPRKKARPKPSYPKTSQKDREAQERARALVKDAMSKQEEDLESKQEVKPSTIKPVKVKPVEVKPVEPKKEIKPVKPTPKPKANKPVVEKAKPKPIEPVMKQEEKKEPVQPTVKPIQQRMSPDDVKAARERMKDQLAGKVVEEEPTKTETKDETSKYDTSKLDVTKIVGMDDNLDETLKMIDSMSEKKSSKKNKGGDA